MRLCCEIITCLLKGQISFTFWFCTLLSHLSNVPPVRARCPSTKANVVVLILPVMRMGGGRFSGFPVSGGLCSFGTGSVLQYGAVDSEHVTRWMKNC